MFKSIIVALIILTWFACADSGHDGNDFVFRSVDVGGKTYAYRIYFPKRRDASTKTPVMLYLHGGGSRGDDNRSQVDGLGSAIAPVKDKIEFIIVVPQCRKNTYWAASEMTNYALAALDETVREFKGDQTRLYLAGFSLGGYGTWQIAAANPGKFAALIPVAGGVVGERPIAQRDRELMIPELLKMLDSPEPYKAVATAIGQTPVWVFHGAKDESVPVEFSRKMVEALKIVGNKNVKYIEYENDGHMIFGKSLSEPGFLEWLAQQKK